VTNDHEYVSFVVITIRSLITGFVTGVTNGVVITIRSLITGFVTGVTNGVGTTYRYGAPDLIPCFFGGVRVAQSLIYSV